MVQLPMKFKDDKETKSNIIDEIEGDTAWFDNKSVRYRFGELMRMSGVTVKMIFSRKELNLYIMLNSLHPP
jgi:hypothetical protein